MGRKSFALAAGALVAAFLISGRAMATPGNLDTNGCHTDSKTNEYHCHQGTGGRVPTPPVRKSSSDICYDKKSQYYAQTTTFTAYRNMKECMASGGRMQK